VACCVGLRILIRLSTNYVVVMFQVHVAMEQETPVVDSADLSAGTAAVPTDSEVQSLNAAQLRLVYLATAADTSCVSHDDDSRQHTVVSVDDITQHMIMDMEGSDNEDNDSIEETEHDISGTYGMATMLQRN